MNKERNYKNVFNANFSELIGKTLVEIGGDRQDLLTFTASDGSEYQMLYYSDCCASCSIEDICGDLDDLLNTPILLAEEVSSTEPDSELTAKRSAEEAQRKMDEGEDYYYYNRYESETWTFYKLSTIKGSVTIRWYGSSNGYYSESATFEQTSLGTGEMEIK